MDLWPLMLPLIGLMVVPATAAPLTVRLVSVGSLPPALLGFLEEGVARELGAAVRMGGNLPLPASCSEGLSQYPGAPFLAALAAARPPGDEFILGVTGVDLTVPGLNFVFGLADPGGRAAVISLARLYPEFYGQPRDPGRFKARAVTEAVHELGHLLGLGHCPDPVCVMAFSNSLADTDRKGPGFCLLCRKMLGK
ncbi:MAG: archaemetzincin family Zn-dependent metalloprotease [Deltaproteobacteria bacterium]|nr:archaemetzincin family Zn-dependent metalloprotease [Deltaproteobacteria bacterium]